MTPVVLRRILALVLIAVTADISRADVSMRENIRFLAPSGEWTNTLRIKGLRMRVDTAGNGENIATIYDLSSGKGYRLDPKHKEAIVVGLKSAGGPKKEVSADDLRHDFKKTGKERQIGAVSCDEYEFGEPGPAASMGHGMTFVQSNNGTLCVSQTTPEGSEIAHFVREAIKRGYGVAARPLAPVQSSIEFYFLGQEPNMLIVAATIQSRTKESGPGINSEIAFGSVSISTISDIKSDSIPDEVFEIPPDWKQKKANNFSMPK